jgi:uncharacterized BrkB/YihY/UPF0761 family membrane protein
MSTEREGFDAATGGKNGRMGRPPRHDGSSDTQRRRLSARVLRRFLDADGTSHTRALAYETMFVVLSGFVGLLGLASLLNVEQVRGVITELGRTIAPGPAGELLAEAAASGSRHATTAAWFGLAAAAIAGTLAMAQIERSGNRLVGSELDRRIVSRYVVAFLLTVTVGVLLAAGALLLGAGRAVPTGFGWSDELRTTWSIVRWPIGVGVVATAMLLLLRVAPRSSLGAWRSVIGGTVVGVILWVAFTGLLSLYFAIGEGSSPYGPLLSIIALLLWSMFGSLALHLGMATAAELSGAPHPKPEDDVRLPEAPPVDRRVAEARTS